MAFEPGNSARNVRTSGSRAATFAAGALAIVALVVAWQWRTGAIGGSDSACYALMARVFADGAWQPRSPLAPDAPWPDATRTAAPAGFLPSALVPGAAVPVCAPGYSVLLAPLVRLFGNAAVHTVPPLAFATLVWGAFLLARRLHSPLAGVAAAGLVATTPIVLFQAVQPMNDITTGALWMAVAVAMCAGRPVLTGLLVGMALLVRPNLVPAAAAAILTVGILAATARDDRRAVAAIRAWLMAAAAAVPPVLVALTLNRVLYGSPFQSGYGDLSVLFAWEHVPVNAGRYGGTWMRTGTPFVLASALAPWLVDPAERVRAWAVGGLAVAVAVVYLFYQPFPEWWYLRFLLPSVALGAVLAAVAIAEAARRVWPRGAPWTTLVVVAGVGIVALRTSEASEIWRLRKLEARFPTTAEVVAERFDTGAVAIALWQSGGLRFWPGRDVVVWDALDPHWLDAALEWLRIHGRPAIIVVERWEEAGFRERFAGQEFGGLDWPPRFDIDRRVRIFVPDDREAYLRGEPIPTEAVFAPDRR